MANVRERPRYFSQNGEDFLLWNLFDRRGSGFFVDVGAFDGIHLSNTYFFENKGWKGICIEPHPKYFPLCRQHRPSSICLNVACVAEESVQTVEFFAEELGLLSSMHGNRMEDVERRYKKRGLEFKGFNKIQVPAATLNAILFKYLPADAEIDFISIDVEGAELEVLGGIDLSFFRPRVMVIEANSWDARNALNAHLVAANGYTEARRLGENIFYVRDRKDAEIIASIAVECHIEEVLHPLGKKYTLRDCLGGKRVQDQRCINSKVERVARWLIGKVMALASGKGR